jgi:hypothetical protein
LNHAVQQQCGSHVIWTFHQNQVSETSKSFVFLIRPYTRIFLSWYLCVCLIIVKTGRCYFLVNVGLIALKALHLIGQWSKVHSQHRMVSVSGLWSVVCGLWSVVCGLSVVFGTSHQVVVSLGVRRTYVNKVQSRVVRFPNSIDSQEGRGT